MTKKRLQNKVKRQNQKIYELETLIKNTSRGLSVLAEYDAAKLPFNEVSRKAFKRSAERVQERLSEIDEKYKGTV